jgi:hypothetical protein
MKSLFSAFFLFVILAGPSIAMADTYVYPRPFAHPHDPYCQDNGDPRTCASHYYFDDSYSNYSQGYYGRQMGYPAPAPVYQNQWNPYGYRDYRSYLQNPYSGQDEVYIREP